jgi:HD-like signal output (HDOD) protein
MNIELLGILLTVGLLFVGVVPLIRRRRALAPMPKTDAPPAPAFPTEPELAAEMPPTPVAALKALVPFEDWPEESLLVFALEHPPIAMPAGGRLFVEGQAIESAYYLLNGVLELSFPGGALRQMTELDEQARYPLCLGRHFPATARALVPILVQPAPLDLLLNAVARANEKKRTKTLELDVERLPPILRESGAFFVFCRSFRSDAFAAPSLPQVALKLRTAFKGGDTDFEAAAKIVLLDPVISAKLMQVANSPLYLGAHPVATCHAALVRLGLNAAQNLVYSIGMRQVYRSENPRVNAALQSAWRESVHVSALCAALAEKLGGADPDKALLAGLVCGIGAATFLSFVGQLPVDGYRWEEIEAALPLLTGPVGERVLRDWDFPVEYRSLPYLLEDWHSDDGEPFGLRDIVRLALWHSRLNRGAASLPPITALPSYGKLKHAALSPEFSLYALHEAKDRIEAIQNLLANR